MKTLIIHPDDFTTHFLCEAYKEFECTLITTPTTSKKLLKQAIKEHDRIIMLGHGDPHGLFARNRYIIDSQFVYLLRDKPDSFYIWCYAEKFMSKYGLKGFGTGMIISDYSEALDHAIKCTDDDINEANQKLALGIMKSLALSIDLIQSTIAKELSSDSNPLLIFNNQNLFTKQ